MPTIFTTTNLAVLFRPLLADLAPDAPISELITHREGATVTVTVVTPDALIPAQVAAVQARLDGLPAPAPLPNSSPYSMAELRDAIDAQFPAMTAGQRRMLYVLAQAAAAARIPRTLEAL